MKNRMKKLKKIMLLMMGAVIMLVTAIANVKAPTVYANDIINAYTLPLNGQWSDKLTGTGSEDYYYKFTVSTAGVINFKTMMYMGAITGFGAGRVDIYDADYNWITYAYLTGGTETSPVTTAKAYGFTQGTYYIKLSFNYDGAYRLYAKFDSYGVTAREGDSFDNSQSLKVGQNVTGVLTYTNKEDWYKINIPYSGKYKQLISGVQGMDWAIFNSNLEQVAGDHFYSAGSDTANFVMPSGTYYVKIFRANYLGKYTYQLSEALPKKGEILTDTNTNAQYKVTKSGRKGGTVSYYCAPSAYSTVFVVPSTVKIDGVSYKVTAVSSSAFANKQGLEKVVIGKNVQKIGANAFSGCASLKTVSFKSGSALKNIDKRAFYKCISLKSITIPAKVTNIGKQAFYGCKKLKKITIKTTKLTNSRVGSNAFKGIYEKAVIKVPRSKYRAYKKLLKKRGIGTKVVIKKY